ncbi:MAG: hypothetical protein JWP04_2076, partial [Belnapia sp.]|nr:hypothetical protein [Belnapia sp.]
MSLRPDALGNAPGSAPGPARRSLLLPAAAALTTASLPALAQPRPVA